MQLLKIQVPKVENKFLQCYLQVENIKLEEMKLYEKNVPNGDPVTAVDFHDANG